MIESVWVFHADRATFACGVFHDRESAETWIARYRLSGVLTQYPVGQGIYDWAVENGYFGREKSATPGFVGSFTSHRQQHYHYESGSNLTAEEA